jgi:Xaa-Pro aminopeptidase
VHLAPRDTLAVRHAKLRDAVTAADLDGLVVTHLPNIFYLTNFLGTAGIAVAMRDRLYLILDFRYASAARDIWNTEFGCPDAEIVPVDRTYDETLVTLIKKLQPHRLGFE